MGDQAVLQFELGAPLPYSAVGVDPGCEIGEIPLQLEVQGVGGRLAVIFDAVEWISIDAVVVVVASAESNSWKRPAGASSVQHLAGSSTVEPGVLGGPGLD